MKNELTIKRKEEILMKRSNLRYGMTLMQYISHKTGRKPCQCSCEACKSQCHTPCLGTPQDIWKIIEAGYGDKLKLTGWAAGMIMGVTDHIIYMVQANAENDWCVFFDTATGLCTLHDKDLKPTEGRLSSHKIQLDNWLPKKSIAWNVAKEWEDPRNNFVMAKVADYFIKQEVKDMNAEDFLPELMEQLAK